MQIVKTSGSTTRPNDTTAYASGDLVANSTTAGSVTPITLNCSARGFKVWRVELARSSAVVTNASFRVHIYKDSPTVANGDNGAWSTTNSGYVGFVDVAAPSVAFTDSANASGVYVNNSVFAPLYFVADKDHILYALIEARAAYTPTAQEVFTVTLLGEAYD